MKSKLFAGAAVAALMSAVPALAQTNLIYSPEPAVVTIDVAVQEIATLTVLNATGTATIDDTSDVTMGNPSSDGSDYEVDHWATLRLATNFDVDGIRITYPKTNNIRTNPVASPTATFNGGAFEWFGAATCTTAATCGSATLGVFPQAGNYDPTATDPEIIGGGGGVVSNDGLEDDPTVGILARSTISGGVGSGVYSNGVHHIGVGLATNWGRTRLDGPLFAAPGTYSIELTATIVPTI